MKVKLRCARATETESQAFGQVIEVGKCEALRMIEDGIADPLSIGSAGAETGMVEAPENAENAPKAAPKKRKKRKRKSSKKKKSPKRKNKKKSGGKK